MLRRSGISRASMKVMSAWAYTVKFGQAKVPAVAPAKNVVKCTSNARKVTKKNLSKLQTPVRKPLGHVSTGHANSPVTIIVGRAVKQNALPLSGAAPKVIFSTAISKKDLKMDEDLSGVCEMFKTPVNERKRKSQVKSGASKTPVGVVEPAVLEPSLLDTPEEPGEMMVSPLTAVSAVKAGRYNKEAVKRLLNDDEESSFMSDVSTLKTDNSSEQQCTKTKTSSVATPKKKPQIPECLTGVKRIMNTPRRNAEPVEDLQGRLLKTPKQKPEQQECLTGVKRIMKTPKPKNEPVEDLRGKLLKTPKQKQEQQECLTGVKRLMRTPRQKTERIKDLKGKLLKTPKRKSEVADISFTGLADLLETPAKISQPEEANTETQKDNTPLDVKRMTKTPKQRSAPVEDMFGIERLMKTPKERSQPVEENFGIKKLMRSPKLAVNHLQTAECGGQTNVGSDLASAKEFTYAPEQPPIGRGSSKMDVSKGETTKVLVEVPEDLLEPSGAKEVIGQDAVKDETPAVTETDPTDPATSMEPIRGRRTKSVKSKAAHHKPEMAEPSQDPGPVRGRRGRKAEPTEHTRDVVEPAQEETRAAPKPKQRRGAIKVSEQIEMVQEASAETLLEPESEQNLSLAKSRSDAPLEQEPVKSKRGRKPKQESVQSKPEDVAHEGEGGDKLKLIPSKHDENKPSEVEVAVEKDVTTIQKKFVRGRKGKLVEESREVGDKDKQEADFEEAISAPRRSKRTEAIVPRAGRQTTRSKKVKEDPSVAQQEVVGDAEPVTSADTVNASTSSQDEVREPAEESVVKLSRGRRAKLQHAEPLEPQPNKAIDGVIEQAELPAPTSHTQQRGRKLISESADLQELAKGTSKETKQQLKLVPKTRGRKTKQEAEPQNPVKKSRSSRTGEEALVSESEKISPQDPGVAKTRRVGVGKSKQEEANVTCDEFTENQDGSIQTTEKPKRGRRRKQVEDVGTSEVPQETSEQNPQRGRGVKSNSKDDISQIIPAKRARRGAATSSTCKEAIKVETSVTVPSSVSAKRGRRAAAKASPESNATDDSNDAIAEVAKPSQRSVSWKTEVEVHEVPRAATVRALRGRRPRLADQSPSESKNADQTEEDLSEKVEEPQPARRTRRGEKAAEEMQPKFRRGRSAKK